MRPRRQSGTRVQWVFLHEEPHCADPTQSCGVWVNNGTGLSQSPASAPLGSNCLYRSGEDGVCCGVNRPIANLRAGWILSQEIVALPVARWPKWSGREPAAAVRADVAQDMFNTRRTKRALIGANARLEQIRRQRRVALFARGAEFEHCPNLGVLDWPVIVRRRRGATHVGRVCHSR
jgi:hypothetical protein